MAPVPGPPTARAARFLRGLVWNVVVFLLVACLVEGLASYSLLLRDVMTTQPLAERLHTRYDAELGWANVPSFFMADVYGPGAYVRTNEDGVRSNHRFSVAVPAGMKRLVCCGDSFTFGWGVDNDHTWCELLASLSPGLETLNLGLGGYGLDQMYLSYKRDGRRFDHHVQLLAFITQDIIRMQSDTFVGYGKPLLDVERGELVVRNVPVPKRAYRLSPVVAQLENLERLRTWELIRRTARKLGGGGDRSAAGRDESAEAQDAKTRLVLVKILEELKRINEEHGSLLVLVYLPILEEIPGDGQPPWIAFMDQTSRSLNVPLISALPAFRELPPDRAARLFIRRGEVRFPGAAGHLNVEGNAFLADVIHRAMRAHPQIARALDLH